MLQNTTNNNQIVYNMYSSPILHPVAQDLNLTPQYWEMNVSPLKLPSDRFSRYCTPNVLGVLL